MKKLYYFLAMAALTATSGMAAELQVATFEDLNLAPESWWVGVLAGASAYIVRNFQIRK